MCMDARDLLRMALDDIERLSLPYTRKSTQALPTADDVNGPTGPVRVFFNLPELALEMLCEEVEGVMPRVVPTPPGEGQSKVSKKVLSELKCSHFLGFCYTFDSSTTGVSERLGVLPKHMASKVRHVRAVSPSKAMFCVELDFWLKK